MPDRLDRYREKRDPRATPEPFGAPRPGAAAPEAPRPFVVQKHAARRLHWDFRLELDGTLRSWAVPKGPSYDPADKRLAVEVEDHPVEYADFEGVIPAGQYGAGPVIVWDRGAWRPHGDPRRALADGKLVFDLAGYKLRGEWTLVRTRRASGGKQEWLLLKHRDALAGPGRAVPEESVLTGRRVEELPAGDVRANAALAEARRLGAPPRRGAGPIRPMRPDEASALPEGPGWLFEVAAGGLRVLARRAGDRTRLQTPGGEELAGRFPEVALALGRLPADAVLDGELVALGEDGRPSPDALRRRARLRGRAEIVRCAIELPVTLLATDLLALGPLDTRPVALRDRKRLLAMLVPRLGPLRYADHVEGSGEALRREVLARGIGGVAARRADAPYQRGRSADWRVLLPDPPSARGRRRRN
ncbi:MAG TPA: DNA polymerase ligase N-terminal domain-containing protein [Anaeromyxobacter sp.]